MVDPPTQGGQDRKSRRVNALLSTYYHIDVGKGIAKEAAEPYSDGLLDGEGFDAQRYFDDAVASGHLKDLRKRTEALDTEVSELDKDMQLLVYENYTKFVRATDVIKQMKFTIEGLQPDIRNVEGNIKRITECQRKVDDGVWCRTRQVELLLKQQRISRKLQTLFDLPKTLQRCLDRGAYGTAVEAYCNCAGFLRQYKDIKTFKSVLEEVDNQMNRIKSALEDRLHSPELSVDESVNSAWTLLDLGEDQAKVANEYLHGRNAVLKQLLKECFDAGVIQVVTSNGHSGTPVAEQASDTAGGQKLQDAEDLQRPESVALHMACSKAASSYVPSLCDTVEGFSKLRKHGSTETGGSIGEDVLSDFVSARVEELLGQIKKLIETRFPPTRVLVSCIHAVRDELRRLHDLLPQLLTSMFSKFLEHTATSAMKSLFAAASHALIDDLCGLHGECKRLQESKTSGLDDVSEEIAKTEASIAMHAFSVLTACQPLLSLFGPDRASCQKLVRGLHARLISFFVTFADACHAYIIGGSGCSAAATLVDSPLVGREHEIDSLEWSGLFGLALVRIGRHFELRAIHKVWLVAKELFVGYGDATAELLPSPSLFRIVRGVTQAVMKHYTLANGQRLAHFFRNSVQNRNWVTVREPREPRLIVEIVLKEVYAFDAQLARILGDPRKVRVSDARRGVLTHKKTAMEQEVERLLAKKMPVFAPIPFNRNGAIVGILRVAFKALYEFMREETFAKYGFQQIQVDCAFLADIVRSDFVEPEDASVLDSLLDEVIQSAKLRCVEPVLMDDARVEALCDEKKKTFKFE